MPTAMSAADRRLPQRSLVHIIVGVVLGLAVLLPAQALTASNVAASASTNNCSRWTSTTRPPSTIRVLRVQSGRVERVDFRKYVVTVMGKEWPSYLPQAVVEAGAVAVKQYAWYHSLGNPRRTKSGQCFDVRDSTGDQLYKPNKARVRPDHHRAVDATWGVTLRKNGQFFMTGYRRGSPGRCGAASTGYKLYALSAKRCANKGWDFKQILRAYYSPGLVIVSGGSSAASSSNLVSTADSVSTPDSASTPSAVSTPSPTSTPLAPSTPSTVAPDQATLAQPAKPLVVGDETQVMRIDERPVV